MLFGLMEWWSNAHPKVFSPKSLPGCGKVLIFTAHSSRWAGSQVCGRYISGSLLLLTLGCVISHLRRHHSSFPPSRSDLTRCYTSTIHHRVRSLLEVALR